MAVTEDAASVLEQFIHDVANLPAEIAHLYEEANAKQDAINSLNAIIATKDGQLQKWVKSSSALVKHPKEDIFNKDILEAYTKVALLQDEKMALVQKACSLLDRYVKRLDVKIRDLQADGAMPLDNRMPSLLRHSEGNLVAIDSNTSTGANTPNPLQPLSINTNTSSFAQSAINRLAHAASANRAQSATAQVHPLHQTQSASAPTASTPLTNIVRNRELPTSNAQNDLKKRRLNLGTLPMPNLPNGTRHASLGPGTPKASTPSGSRAGSVPRGGHPGANKKSAMLPKKPLVQALTKKKLSKHKHKHSRRLLSGSRASPATTTGDELSADAESGSEDGDYQSQDGKKEDGDMDEASDDTKYCYCHDVSHGDMIACDNADCAIQWFHWTCAGITSEPQGEWLCKECRKLPRDKIKKS